MNKTIKFLGHVYMTLFMLMISVESKAWEGSGTESSPYLISNCEQMKSLAVSVNNGTTYKGKYFKVVVPELDFSGKDCIPIGTGSYYSISSDLFSKVGFCGTFDGNGVVIKNFVYNNSEQSYIGLFGYVYDGFIKNITIDKSCSFTGYSYVGGLAGSVDGKGGNSFTIHISNCNNYANVKAVSTAFNKCYAGGIAAWCGIPISSCSNYGNISANGASVGGIVGYASGSWISITDCHNRGDVSGCFQKIGGIVGYMDGGIMRNCTVASCTITANSPYVGAILGCQTSAKLSQNCYNSDVIVVKDGIALSGSTPRGCGKSGGLTDIAENDGAVLGVVSVDNGGIDASPEGSANYENNGNVNSDTDLNGKVIGNIYYNINSNNGGYSSAEGCIVVNTPTNDSNIDGMDIFGEEFKNNYSGIVFKVQTGSGSIKLKAETTGGMMLKVKIGNREPYSMMLSGQAEVSFPYNVTAPTYIYIYGGVMSPSPNFVHRASTNDALKIYRLSWQGSGNGIEILRENEQCSDIIYNIAGQRLTTPKKGLNIIGGKKIIVR